MPAISVIVPVYQAEALLPQCVESVLAQTFSDWELLLIDDGSRDGSPTLCDGYAIPNAEDTPYIEELARQEGILLDPVYTGKAWAKFLTLVKEGYFDGQEHIAFVHTGGAAALFAMDLG